MGAGRSQVTEKRSMAAGTARPEMMSMGAGKSNQVDLVSMGAGLSRNVELMSMGVGSQGKSVADMGVGRSH